MEKKPVFALMQKDKERLAVEPSQVAAHELEAWNVVGIAEVDADGNVVEIGKVIETPAHTIQTPDGFLRVIPKFEDTPPAVVQPVVVPLAVKAEEKPKK